MAISSIIIVAWVGGSWSSPKGLTGASDFVPADSRSTGRLCKARRMFPISCADRLATRLGLAEGASIQEGRRCLEERHDPYSAGRRKEQSGRPMLRGQPAPVQRKRCRSRQSSTGIQSPRLDPEGFSRRQIRIGRQSVSGKVSCELLQQTGALGTGPRDAWDLRFTSGSALSGSSAIGALFSLVPRRVC